MSSVAVVGLGSMGRPMARNLLAAGHEVTVWNRSPGPVEDLVAEGAHRAERIEDAFASGVVFSVLADDGAVADAFLDSGVLAQAPAGALHVNLATVSTPLARRAAAVHAGYGVGYLAAPVFGRATVAEQGALNVVVAGDPGQIDRVQELFDVIGSRTWRLGDVPEQANAVKILGNYLLACAIESLGEAVGLAEKAGVDPAQLVELMTTTLFPGPVYATYGGLIAERRYQPAGFTTVLGRKDVHLALDAADAVGATLPFGAVLREVFEQALAQGRADDDWASIAELRR